MQASLKEMRKRSALVSIVGDKAQIVKREGLNLIREKARVQTACAAKQRGATISLAESCAEMKGGGVPAGDFG